MRNIRVAVFSVVVVCLVSGPVRGQIQQGTPQTEWMKRAKTFPSKYYRVLADLPEAEALALAEHMDATFESYLSMFAQLPVRMNRLAKLELYLFARQSDYIENMRVLFDNDATGSWGKCVTRGNKIYLVGFRGNHSVEEMEPLLQHEGFHQFASHLFNGMPPWANEGLAEVFARGVVVGNRLALGEYRERDRRRLLAAIDSRRILDFDQFFSIDGKLWSHQVVDGSAGNNYLQAWSIVHFLLFAEDGKYRLPFLTFLVQLNRGSDWKHAFVTSLGVPDFDQIQTLWTEHVKSTPTTDYRALSHRLRFLAEGLKSCYAEKKHPMSFEEFRKELVSAQFEWRDPDNEKAPRLRSTDPGVFQLPLHEKGSGYRLLQRETPRRGGKVIERLAPLPLIATQGDLPVIFIAGWEKDENGVRYEVLVEPPASPLLKKLLNASEQELKRKEVREARAAKKLAARKFRVWTSANGQFQVRAKLLTSTNTSVKLQTSDERIIDVSLNDLSEEDRVYVRGHN